MSEFSFFSGPGEGEAAGKDPEEEGGVEKEIHIWEGVPPVSAKPNVSVIQEESLYYCPECSIPYDDTRPMLNCRSCEEWYHGECVDFTCKNCSKADSKEDEDVIQYYKTRYEELKKEQEAVKKNLREIIATKEKELTQRIKAIQDDHKRNEKTRDSNETKLLKAENKSLKDDVEASKTKTQELQNQLNKIKRNLDASNCQYTKVRKEKTDALRLAGRLEASEAKKEVSIDTLKVIKVDLERQIEAHERFIKNEFGGEEHLTKADLQNQIEEFKRLMITKDENIKRLEEDLEKSRQDMERKEGVKLKESKEEAKKLKANVTVLEEHSRELEETRAECMEKSMILEKELQLEKDINKTIKDTAEDNLKMKKTDQTKHPENPSRKQNKDSGNVCTEIFLNHSAECMIKDCTKVHITDRTIKRGICVHEFKKEGSCTFKSNCKFFHDFPNELRGNAAVISKIESISVDMERKRNSTSKEIISTSQEPQERRDDKQHKIKTTRICVHEFERSGSCGFGKDCMFVHNFPPELRKNEDVNAKYGRKKKIWGGGKKNTGCEKRSRTIIFSTTHRIQMTDKEGGRTGTEGTVKL